MSKSKTIGNIATFPGREDLFKIALESIISQVDQLNVYLNEYSNVPDFLVNSKINVVLSRDAKGDLKDNGKFYFLDRCSDDSYYFTFDDDIKYPSDYVSKVASFLKSKNDNVVAGVHGIVFHSDFKSFRKTRTSFYFEHGLKGDMMVSALGTGTLAFKKSLLVTLTLEEFKEVGMADLWLASFCKKNGVNMFCMKRDDGWLLDLHRDVDNEYTLWNESQSNEIKQNELIENNELWKLNTEGEQMWRTYLEKQCIELTSLCGVCEQENRYLKKSYVDFKKTKSFLLGDLFFRSMKNPSKIVTLPLNLLKILLEREK